LGLTFRGGIRIDENKNAKKSAVIRMPAPETVTIPVIKDSGSEYISLINIGDRVDVGQIIGFSADDRSCPVHSSVSGVVTDIIEKDVAGNGIKNIVIKNDGEMRISPDIKPAGKSISDITALDVILTAKNAGIVDSDFPLYKKIEMAAEEYKEKIEYLIVNCAEPEPYLSAKYRFLFENPVAVINGLKILIKGLGLRSSIIAVEERDLDAANKIERLINNSKLVKVKILNSKYPQASERQIVSAVTGREYGIKKNPEDVGCLVVSPFSCAALYAAFATGIPVIEKIITVGGDCFKNSQNVIVPIGTAFGDVTEFCGGFSKEPYAVVSGGVMTGKTVWDMTIPVEKNTVAITALTEKSVFKYRSEGVCIHCGRCVSSCPMHLMPLYLAKYAKDNVKNDYCDVLKIAEKYSMESCIECGTCSYVCPGYVPIVQYIRLLKERINVFAVEDGEAETVEIAELEPTEIKKETEAEVENGENTDSDTETSEDSVSDEENSEYSDEINETVTNEPTSEEEVNEQEKEDEDENQE